jgi:hypothetical protein
MENNKAKWLLENLLARLATRKDGRQELPGIITEVEQEALRLAAELLDVKAQEKPHHIAEDQGEPSSEGAITDKGAGEGVGADSAEELAAKVNGEPLVYPDEGIDEDPADKGISVEVPAYFDDPVSEDFRLCIDFGTAMSKVTLVHDGAGKDGGDEIQVLELGDVAGQDPADGPFELLISSVYISNDGLVYFGKSALEVSEQEAGSGDRQRIDNMKRFLSEDGIDQVIKAEFNPTGIEIEYRDVVLFYLTYLTWVINQCTDNLGYDRSICRRFAMPVFDGAKARQYSGMLSRMLGDAQVAAEHFGELIDSGIELEELIITCDAIRDMDLEYPFVGSPVTEPLGVASSLVSEDGAANNLSMVIDIGAGTTDISLFRIRVDPDGAVYVANQIPRAARGLTMAGNYIDRVLVQKVLSKAEVGLESPDYRRIRNDIERKVRVYKEELFEGSQIDIPLPNGDVVQIGRDDFLQSPSIHKFQEELRGKMAEILEEVDEFFLRTAPRQELVLVLTGGGASLPFVQSLVGETIEVGNLSVKTVKSHDFPEWMVEDHADLENIFPRIAVSLGGARDNVIQPYDKDNTGRELA